MQKKFHLKNREHVHELILEHKSTQHQLLIKTDDGVETQLQADVFLEADQVILKTPDGEYVCSVARDEKGFWIGCQGFSEYFAVEHKKPKEESTLAADNELRAPMTGRVVAVRVQSGQAVQAGEVVAILEAMKMEFRIEAPFASQVIQVQCKQGDLVELGQTLIVLEAKTTA